MKEQALGIELYKVTNGLPPVTISQVFHLKDNIRKSENTFKTRNVKSVRCPTDTSAPLGPNIWSIIPSKIKEEQYLKLFTKKIKQWKPEWCPCVKYGLGLYKLIIIYMSYFFVYNETPLFIKIGTFVFSLSQFSFCTYHFYLQNIILY